MELDLARSTDGVGRTVLSLSGALDLLTRDEVVTAGLSALETGSAPGVVLDLSGITFMDSTGIGALVELATRADEMHGQLTVRAPSARALRVLQLTGLDTVLPIEPIEPTPTSRP